jgi:hypothetical protein
MRSLFGGESRTRPRFQPKLAGSCAKWRAAISILSEPSPNSETVDNFVAAQSLQAQQGPTRFNRLAISH